MTSHPLQLSERETVALFILLRNTEEQLRVSGSVNPDLALDATLSGLLDRVESRLFDVLSIEQIEEIEEIYGEMMNRGLTLSDLSG